MNNKHQLFGNNSTGLIGARALIEQTMAERENPPMIIIPNASSMNVAMLSEIIKEHHKYPLAIIAFQEFDEQ